MSLASCGGTSMLVNSREPEGGEWERVAPGRRGGVRGDGGGPPAGLGAEVGAEVVVGAVASVEEGATGGPPSIMVKGSPEPRQAVVPHSSPPSKLAVGPSAHACRTALRKTTRNTHITLYQWDNLCKSRGGSQMKPSGPVAPWVFGLGSGL